MRPIFAADARAAVSCAACKRWLRKHWIALFGLLPLIPASFKGVLALITWGGDIDFVVSQKQDPGWVGQMINWLIDPPGWAILPLLSLGLACIFLDSRRRLAGMFAGSYGRSKL